MSYVTGFLLAVPEEKREAYREMAQKSWELFREYGALGMQENWGTDVPDGKVTSFGMATKQQPGEAVVFSWMEWPDRATCDSAWEKMMKDPRMEALGEMPFDGKRMMWGGFEPLVTCRADAPQEAPA